MAHKETIQTNEHTYTVVLHAEPDGGYTVSVPAIRGCISRGATFDEACDNIREAIEGHLEALNKGCFGVYG